VADIFWRDPLSQYLRAFAIDKRRARGGARAARRSDYETLASFQPRPRLHLGAPDAALRRVEIFLSLPSAYKPHNFRLDPVWDPIRKDTRFEKLLAHKKL
jgi:hypothetical protein